MERANQERAKKWTKEAKIGEGTYAVVYRGAFSSFREQLRLHGAPGRDAATGAQVAIKKIKVGQFKDGLDMSAVREVQYLRELSHPNVIKVRSPTRPASLH